MAIKLVKVCAELKVGVVTAADFLRKKGYEVGDPLITRIDDEQHLLLAKEFNPEMAARLVAERSKPKPAPEPEAPAAPQPEPPRVVETKVPEEVRPSVKEVGHIDLDNLNRKKADTQKPEAPKAEAAAEAEPAAKPAPKAEAEKPQPKAEPKPEVKPEAEPAAKPEPTVKKAVKKAEKPAAAAQSAAESKKEPAKAEAPKQPAAPAKPEKSEPKPKAEAKPEAKAEAKPESAPKAEAPAAEAKPAPKAEPEVFRYHEPPKPKGPVVLGQIDLSRIDQSTRPKQKTKEQKRKEREEREKQRQQKQTPQASQPKNGGNQPASQQQPSGEKRKRERFKASHVDLNNPAELRSGKSKRSGERKAPKKPEVAEEDVQRQVKETLARLSNKSKGGKGAKYRKEKREHVREQMELQMEQENAQSKVLKLTEFVTANELANMMNVPVNKVIATCMSLGLMVSINQRLDAETINIVADEFGFSTEFVSSEVIEAIGQDEPDADEDLEPRAPIVTVMGHVDHGKTSLLDHIRNTNVIAGEAGGITQHIGAYNVKLKNGQRITFLDTPGHEAFTAMRARGAQVTDIAIIIVAADDSVMPQTVEAINHASAAGVPIIFAINKIDKPGANPEKIREELANMNYLVEDWGGKYQCQEISAKKGQGVYELLEKVLLEAELLDLKANPNRRAVGSIIESSLDKGRGYVATILVQDGTLNVGDIVLAGTSYGRVKAMFNERNQKIDHVLPGEPALILGLNGAPQAGDKFNVMSTDQEARDIANRREQLQREQDLRTRKHFGLEELGRRIALGDFKELNIIVKADVDGSVEALSDSLLKLSTPNIQVNVIHKAVGAISDGDILLAAASNAIIVGFQVRPTATARKLAEREEVDVRIYSIIYDAIEEIKAAMEGLLAPEIKEEVTGTLEVLQVFKISKVGMIAGCKVREGKIKRSSRVRVIRDGIVIHTGDIDSLKRGKDDVKEVGLNTECGLNIRSYNDIREGDLVEAFEQIEVKQTL